MSSHRQIILALIGLALTACGQGDRGAGPSSDEGTAAYSPDQPRPREEAGAQNEAEEPDSTSAPQIAYRYGFGYRLRADRIDEVQQAHVALCDELGPTRCRIDSMERRSGEGEYSSASLVLRVDAELAREFGDRLDAVVDEAGGESSDRTIDAEDLSRQIVDTEARIRAKQALADRLLTLIQNRSGSVGDLVEAERAFAQAQEELDSARTWLAEMRRRVAMSVIQISYNSRGPQSGFWTPVRDSLASTERLLGVSVGAIISLVIVALPWAIIALLAIWGVRRFRRRTRNARSTDAEAADAAGVADDSA